MRAIEEFFHAPIRNILAFAILLIAIPGLVLATAEPVILMIALGALILGLLLLRQRNEERRH